MRWWRFWEKLIVAINVHYHEINKVKNKSWVAIMSRTNFYQEVIYIIVSYIEENNITGNNDVLSGRLGLVAGRLSVSKNWVFKNVNISEENSVKPKMMYELSDSSDVTLALHDAQSNQPGNWQSEDLHEECFRRCCKRGMYNTRTPRKK